MVLSMSRSEIRQTSKIGFLLAVIIVFPFIAITPNLSFAYGEFSEQQIPSYGLIQYQPTQPEDYCYHTAGINIAGMPNDYNGKVAQINQFTNLVGKDLYMYWEMGGLWFTPTQRFWMCDYYKPMLDSGLIKALSMSIQPATQAANDNWTVVEIANGQWDSLIRSFAVTTKAFSYPLWIRLGGEMNICQGDASGVGAPSFGKDPLAYVNAWKRFVDIFRQEGVTNAIFVWNPNCVDIGPHHWTEYYPGDDYVDWVGIDMYQYQPTVDPAWLMSGIYDDYCAKKPIGIFEWGVNWNGENYPDSVRATWTTKFFDAVETRPQIKLIQYFYTTDFVFDASTFPLTTAVYSNRIADPRYIVEAR
jgi:hypothetical protein